VIQGVDGMAEAVAKMIKDSEQGYQSALNESYVQLSDNTFKGLRRALPVTRNKLDWNKASTLVWWILDSCV
jgi:capping protein alpha